MRCKVPCCMRVFRLHVSQNPRNCTHVFLVKNPVRRTQRIPQGLGFFCLFFFRFFSYFFSVSWFGGPPPQPPARTGGAAERGMAGGGGAGRGRQNKTGQAGNRSKTVPPAPAHQTQNMVPKKNSVKTFGQNFRSKLSVKTFGQNFRSKLSVKTFGQNVFGTQTLNNLGPTRPEKK